MRTQSKTTKLPKARERAGNQVVIGLNFHLIGWESGACFLDQSPSEKQKNASSDYFWLNWSNQTSFISGSSFMWISLSTVQHSLLLGQCFQIPQGAVCRPSSTKHFITCLDLRRRDSVKLKRKGESCRRLARVSSQLRFYQLQNSQWQNQLNWFLNVTIRYGQYEHWALMKKRW